jgi:hypothetical protein
MKISRTAVAGPLAVALAIPAFAVGQSAPSEEAQPPSTAYGVVCQRQGASKVDNDTQPGTEFSRCVSSTARASTGRRALAAPRASHAERRIPGRTSGSASPRRTTSSSGYGA